MQSFLVCYFNGEDLKIRHNSFTISFNSCIFFRIQISGAIWQENGIWWGRIKLYFAWRLLFAGFGIDWKADGTPESD